MKRDGHVVDIRGLEDSQAHAIAPLPSFPMHATLTTYWRKSCRVALLILLAGSPSTRLNAQQKVLLDPGRPEPTQMGALRLVGLSVGGRPIHCQEFGSGDDVLLVIATIHGNEAAGTPLVAQFSDCCAHIPKSSRGERSRSFRLPTRTAWLPESDGTSVAST